MKRYSCNKKRHYYKGKFWKVFLIFGLVRRNLSPNESKIGNFENESILTRNRPETTAISWRDCFKYWSWLRQIIVYQHLPRPAMVTNKIQMTMTDPRGKSLISKSPIFCLQGMKNPQIQQIASLFLTTFWCTVKCCKKV